MLESIQNVLRGQMPSTSTHIHTEEIATISILYVYIKKSYQSFKI